LVIAARKALATVGKVLIIDGDAHFGDGTVSCLSVLGLTGQVINITRDRGIGEAQADLNVEGWFAYTEALIKEHRPGVILYQAGADAWEGDPYGSGYLSFEAMGYRDEGIFRAAIHHGVPLAWNLAGGYSEPMEKTVALHLQTLAASDRLAVKG
jgi:acetoin utilization deacetylase AcuC-like enzyme